MTLTHLDICIFKSPFDPDVSQDQDLGRRAFHKFSYNFFSLVRTGVPLIFFKTVNPNQQVSFSSAGQGHFSLKMILIVVPHLHK